MSLSPSTHPPAKAPEQGEGDLMAFLKVIVAKLEVIEAKVNGDQLRLLTARQLVERWNIGGQTDRRRLENLRRICDRRGLKALPGQDGWNATFAFAQVISAEAR